MARAWSKPARVGGNPVLRNGPEQYDDVKVGPSGIVKVAAGDYRMLYEGIDSSLDPGGSDDYNSACYATSPDGLAWTKQGRVLAPNTSGWENYELCPTSLVWDAGNSQWVLFYHAGNNSGVRKLGRATSPDLTAGGTWTKYGSNPILTVGGSGAFDEGYLADCKVIRVSATDWLLYYVGRDTSGGAAVGLATSSDGITWAKSGSNPVFSAGASGQWDDGTLMAWWPLRITATDWVAYYVASDAPSGAGTSQLGRAFSADGITWERDPLNPVLADATDDDITDSIEGLLDEGRTRLYYGQFDLVGDTLRGKGYAVADPGGTILDTFTRADNAALGTASAGGGWIADYYGAGAADPDIVGNRAKGVAASYSMAYHPNEYGPNCYAGFQNTETSDIFIVALLTSNVGVMGSKTGYELDWDRTLNTWSLYRYTGAAEPVIASGSATAPAVGDYVRLVIFGPRVSFEKSTDGGRTWTEVGGVIDNTHRSVATKPAFAVAQNQFVDNFIADNYQAVAGVPEFARNGFPWRRTRPGNGPIVGGFEQHLTARLHPVFATAAAGAYELNAETGSYNTTGANATPLAARALDATSGSYSVGGLGATIVAARSVAATAGSYNLTGSPASPLTTRIISSDPGSYTSTGAAATVGRAISLSADPGVYAVTGTAATAVSTRTLSADPGAYTTSGSPASVVTTRALAASPGAYVTTGTDTTVVTTRVLSATPGTYAVTGTAATVISTRALAANPGTYTTTGSDAAALAARAINAASGSYSTAGTDATLVYTTVGAFTLDAQPGTYNVTGTASSPTAARTLPANAGSYTTTGATADLVHVGVGAYTLNADPGSYALTGTATTPAAARLFTAAAGSYAITGASTGFAYARGINAGSGSYSVAGNAVVTLTTRMVSADAGFYTITGAPGTLTFAPTEPSYLDPIRGGGRLAASGRGRIAVGAQGGIS